MLLHVIRGIVSTDGRLVWGTKSIWAEKNDDTF